MTCYFCWCQQLFHQTLSWWTPSQKATGFRCTRRAACEPVRRFRPASYRRAGGIPKPSWVRKAILGMHAEGGKSYRELMNTFNRLHAHKGMSLCLTTVYTWIQQHCTEMETVRRNTRNRFPAHTRANLRWCLDGTGKQDAQGTTHFILGLIDHGARLNLVLRRLKHADAQTILEHVAAAVNRFGKPRFIRTDNAPVFHSDCFKKVLPH